MSKLLPSKLLLASIHDVGPRSEAQVDQLIDIMAPILGGMNMAMLVVPDHWGEAPLAQAPAFQAKLRGWAEQGVEMFVHGWFHKDLAQHTGMAAIKARHMTASEGEFLGLSHAEAARRMADGRKLIEDIIGRPTAGFIAPAWLYGEGARAALAESGFPLAEDHFRVWRPDSGQILTRGPVITWASRSKGRQRSSRFFAALARNALTGQGVARIATHPGDVTVPALVDSIRATYTRFMQGRRAGRYAELLRPSGTVQAAF
ncbi:MAG TPA: polysaccharide deacetylase family protein [Novosphingobium sp.]|nr:polysaccharide deacetylase family protein [Novosphingobium sp.]